MFESLFGSRKHAQDAQGIALLKAGKLPQALAHFSSRVSRDPGDIDSILQIAKIHFRQARYAQSKEWLRKLKGAALDEFQLTQVLDVTNFRKLASENYFNSYPVFSPDGRRIAFSSARRDTSGDGKIRIEDRPGLYVVELASGTETCVVPDDFYNSQPAFSADGMQIAYLSARQDTNQDGKIDHTDSPALYRKDMLSGKEELLVEAVHRPKFPSFSPDGRTLLFCAWYAHSRVCGVYLLDLSTKQVKPVQGIFESNFPSFSPAGDRILFASWRRDTNKDGNIDLRDNSGLYEIHLETGAESLAAPDDYSNSYPHYSPDGESIVYLSRRRDTNNDGQINSLDNSGIYVRRLARGKERVVASDEHYNKFPAFSADGRRVLFLGSWRARQKPALEEDLEHSEYFDNKGIHCVDAGGGNEREIVTTKYYGCRFLCTSPTENSVAYISWRKDSNRGLYLAPFDRFPTPEELAGYIDHNL